ncbi:LysR family transcriptional regulator [Cohnella nanjingensis]|uniref:LysR family transcriptional regulator n=1 Tax=Cohnella nanjingensis TaxID=1387779 RepID=A0A7X0VF32_9BACL|nr:LysR family transcriptional regulator [Cohnella nanjingensis]MBB6671381.1 LysR family transcriptional regulator [Cohnella nanjingensis]
MDIRHLQYVTEIARRRSFTRAAESLHITQPTISKMIKNLESELNAELFVRDGKRLRLTDAGETILRHAGPILQGFERLQAELDDLTYLNKGSIRIGLPPMAGANFFPDVFKRFQSRYPGIAIKIAEDGARKTVERLGNGELDAGVVLAPIAEDVFESFPLSDDRMKVILHPSHAMAGRDEIGLAELAAESFILFNNDFALHDRIVEACASRGFAPRIVHESAQWDFIGEMVGAELGIAMLPGTVCRQLSPDKVRAIPLADPVIPWRLAMAWRREGYLSRAAREWIAFTRSAFGAGD